MSHDESIRSQHSTHSPTDESTGREILGEFELVPKVQLDKLNLDLGGLFL